MKRLLVIGVVAIGMLVSSCGQQDMFNQGPIYDFEGNMAIDTQKINDYLASTPIDSLYRVHDPSGVVVIVQEEGNGTRPVVNNIVHTDYTGMLLDGTVFDTSIKAVAQANDIFEDSREYTVLSFALYQLGGSGSVIPGWNYGFRRLRSGSKAILLIPSPHGYRDARSSDKIPPNSVLRFDVHFRGMD